jgi:hypothetical protein
VLVRIREEAQALPRLLARQQRKVRAVALNKDGNVYLSLRPRPSVIETIEKFACKRGVSLEQGFSLMLREQLDRLEREQAAHVA